ASFSCSASSVCPCPTAPSRRSERRTTCLAVLVIVAIENLLDVGLQDAPVLARAFNGAPVDPVRLGHVPHHLGYERVRTLRGSLYDRLRRRLSRDLGPYLLTYRRTLRKTLREAGNPPLRQVLGNLPN